MSKIYYFKRKSREKIPTESGIIICACCGNTAEEYFKRLHYAEEIDKFEPYIEIEEYQEI